GHADLHGIHIAPSARFGSDLSEISAVSARNASASGGRAQPGRELFGPQPVARADRLERRAGHAPAGLGVEDDERRDAIDLVLAQQLAMPIEAADVDVHDDVALLEHRAGRLLAAHSDDLAAVGAPLRGELEQDLAAAGSA